MNNYELALNVPRYDPEKLVVSTLVLADLIEKVSSRSIGTGMFVMGSTKVRPRITNTFRRDEKMGIYMKAYNFTPDEKTQKPSGVVDYEIVKSGTNEKVLEFSEAVGKMPGVSASQVTVEQVLPLQTLTPGQYTLKVKVTDNLKKQTLTPSVNFTVN